MVQRGSVDVNEIMDHIMPDINYKEIIRKGKKFNDLAFPSQTSSMCEDPDRRASYVDYKWKHADDIFGKDNYTVFKDIDPTNVKQGELGDCYFLCAITALAEYPERLKRIFLTNEVNKSDCYVIEAFVQGKPQKIVMDGNFIYKEQTKTPAFSQSVHNELWVMLLEKAWAKVNGCFDNIIAGNAEAALGFLTGAPTITIDHKHLTHEGIWKKIIHGYQKEYVITASSGMPGKSKIEYKEQGLISSHAYTLIKAMEVVKDGGKVRLLQLRNPWGRFEWSGDWSDKSRLWTEELKKECGLEVVEDGIFFISLEDYLKYYGHTTICKYHDKYVRSDIELVQHRGKYILLKFDVGSHTRGFMSTYQYQERMMRTKYENYKYSALTLILAKREGGKGGKYKFIARGEGSHYNCNLEFHGGLEPGRYMAFIQIMWKFAGMERFTFSTYTDKPVLLKGLSKKEHPEKEIDILSSAAGKDAKIKNFKFKGKLVGISYIVYSAGENKYCVWLNETEDLMFKGTFTFHMKNMKFTKHGLDVIEIQLLPGERVLKVMTCIDTDKSCGYGSSYSYSVSKLRSKMRIIFLLLFIASSLALLTLPLTKRKVSVARKFSSYFNEISEKFDWPMGDIMVGEFFGPVFIGQQKQELLLKLDIGFPCSWIPNAECTKCGARDKFNEHNSNTYVSNNIPVDFSNGQSGKISGVYATDSFGISEGTMVTTQCFISANSDGNLQQFGDGGMGLSRLNKYNGNTCDNYITNLVAQNLTEEPIVGLYLDDSFPSMHIGGINEQDIKKEKVHYFPNVAKEDDPNFVVNVKTVGLKGAGYDDKKTFDGPIKVAVTTATTDIKLPKSSLEKLVKLMPTREHQCNLTYGLYVCIGVVNLTNEDFPSLWFQIEGKNESLWLRVQPTDYVNLVSYGTLPTTQLAMYNFDIRRENDNEGDLANWVIGTPFLANYYSLFTMKESADIGFGMIKDSHRIYKDWSKVGTDDDVDGNGGKEDDDGLSTGMIVMIVLCVLVGLLVIGTTVYCCYVRRKNRKENIEDPEYATIGPTL